MQEEVGSQLKGEEEKEAQVLPEKERRGAWGDAQDGKGVVYGEGQKGRTRITQEVGL